MVKETNNQPCGNNKRTQTIIPREKNSYASRLVWRTRAWRHTLMRASSHSCELDHSRTLKLTFIALTRAGTHSHKQIHVTLTRAGSHTCTESHLCAQALTQTGSHCTRARRHTFMQADSHSCKQTTHSKKRETKSLKARHVRFCWNRNAQIILS